jgi:hypothetical protein
MLSRFLNKTDELSTNIIVNQIVWSTLRRQIKTFLDTSWKDGHQLIIFRHSSLEKVITDHFTFILPCFIVFLSLSLSLACTTTAVQS